jgi:hypothetical protein
VAAGVFQINTAVATFQRLVNTLGTPKDTPDLRERMYVTALSPYLPRSSVVYLRRLSFGSIGGGIPRFPGWEPWRFWMCARNLGENFLRLDSDPELGYVCLVDLRVLSIGIC